MSEAKTSLDKVDHESLGSESYDYEDPSNYNTYFTDEFNPKGLRKPTEVEKKTLRRVLGSANLSLYLICVVELAERASYYSSQTVLTNFIQRPLPDGSTTGAPTSHYSNESAGALGLGLHTASALTLLLTFLAYVVPLYGGFVADTKTGKVKAIWIGVYAGLISHILFLVAGIPKVIALGHGIVPLIFAILTLAFGTGFIKPNLLPLLLDQYPYDQDMVRVLPSGETVIVDRAKSLERVTLIFYWAINVGAFFMLPTSYAARRIGYWLAFLIPLILYLIVIGVVWWVAPKLHDEPPQGSVMVNFWKIFRVTFSGGWIKRYRQGQLWEYARPSVMAERGVTSYKKSGITWDDQWVLDVKQTLDSCKIFVFYPLYLLSDGGIGSIATSQAGAMTTKGVPNDLFNNFNPLTIIVLIPFLNNCLYPLLRKWKINFYPSYRITLGFFLAAMSQVAGAIIQWKVYTTSPCGYYATTCEEVSPISAWQEVSTYILGAASECFAMTTVYELAYTRAPPKMKGLVMALCLFASAISAALGEAVTPALQDPYLIWPFVGIAVAGFVATGLFFIFFRKLHVTMERERIEREHLDGSAHVAGPELQSVKSAEQAIAQADVVNEVKK